MGTTALTTLRRRADFVAASKGGRQSRPTFTLQARRRTDTEAEGGPRVGYTCSKKVGNAVARNRAKRRLRAAASQILPRHGRPGWDYVLVGRPVVTAAVPFGQLCTDLATALAAIHAKAPL